MGLVVGIVVVAQTIYASTVDHLREFGTLKAMGATNAYICRIIILQATIAAVIGYTLGLAIASVVVRGAARGGAVIELPWELAVGMFGVALAMCVGASLVSIHKVTGIDPAMVFKG
jgi:putative ABC transport system permease protein